MSYIIWGLIALVLYIMFVVLTLSALWALFCYVAKRVIKVLLGVKCP